MQTSGSFVYILASDTGVLFIGVTSDLERRMQDHKQWIFQWFAKKYHCKKLVYVDQTPDIREAITREKQIKKWSKPQKEHLIQTNNPTWKDLSQEW